jgi:hypothetical protein
MPRRSKELVLLLWVLNRKYCIPTYLMFAIPAARDRANPGRGHAYFTNNRDREKKEMKGVGSFKECQMFVKVKEILSSALDIFRSSELGARFQLSQQDI